MTRDTVPPPHSLVPQIEIKVSLNIKRSDAEILYDEIEGLIAKCVDVLLERQGGDLDFYKKIERTLSTNNLTTYLSEELKQEVKVLNVAVHQNFLKDERVLCVSVEVPNVWAFNYGAQVDDLEAALDYLRDNIKKLDASPTPPTLPSITTAFYGTGTTEPRRGAIYYDTVRHEMRTWDGGKWVVAA